MPERLEDLLRACTVYVAGPNPGAGFFVAPGKVLTCHHVIGDGLAASRGSSDLIVRWERDGEEPAELPVTGALVLSSRGRPVPALEADYPDIVVLDVDAPAGHPCVFLDIGMPSRGDAIQAYGYPEEGGGIRLTPVALDYRGIHGHSPTAYLDLKFDTVKQGMSGAAVLNLRTGGVCGIIVASKNPRRDDGALAVPWREVVADLDGALAANRAFHENDPLLGRRV